jgi:hypothetical protein
MPPVAAAKTGLPAAARPGAILFAEKVRCRRAANVASASPTKRQKRQNH